MLDKDFPKLLLTEIMRQIGFTSFPRLLPPFFNAPVKKERLKEILDEAKNYLGDPESPIEIPDLTDYSISQIAVLIIDLASQISPSRDVHKEIIPMHFRYCKGCFQFLTVFTMSIIKILANPGQKKFSVEFDRLISELFKMSVQQNLVQQDLLKNIIESLRSRGQAVEFNLSIITEEQEYYLKKLLPTLSFEQIYALSESLNSEVESGNLPEDIEGFEQLVMLAIAGADGNQTVH